ncbi:MAG TPA: histidine phosphatase family protein [Actinomycetota bacterium]
MRFLEVRRHADADGDALTEEGKRKAERVGRQLTGNYHAVFTSPAKRAAETAAWFLRGLGQKLPPTHGVTEGLASSDPDKVADAFRQMLAAVPEDGRALAVGHTPIIESGVRALTGQTVEPLGRCEGVLLAQEGDGYRVVEEYRLA